MSTVWFVTGSSSGFGLYLVKEALATGHRVVATLRKPESIKTLTDEYGADQLLVCKVDVTKPSEVAAAFKAAEKYFGRVDVVFNNAGYCLLGELESTPNEDARHQMEVNFWGAVTVTKEAIKFFREMNPKGHGGTILHVSSSGGFVGNPALSFYSASKFALEGFVESVSKELPSSWNIRNVIIEPGGFRTDLKRSTVALPQHPAYAASDTPSSQFCSMLGSMEFMGDPVKAAKVFLQLVKEKELPMRMQLGADCTMLVKQKAQQVIDDANMWEDLASSTIADDAVDHTEMLRKNL